MPWSATNRSQHIEQSQARSFDLIIVGGGVTGAGVAREAALRGLNFCMLDKQDFAFGTSSRSSKLAHGGLRYLSGGEYKLVRESTTERNWLRAALPHNVRPLGFMYCTFERGQDRPLKIRFALRLYDLLSNAGSKYKNYRRARFMKPAEVAELEPAFTQSEPELGKLDFAGLYYDTNIDDARLTVETIKESLELAPGSVALNYAKVVDYVRENGQVTGVTVRDEFSGAEFTVRGKVVAACGGIWTDEILKNAGLNQPKIYPTKGVHLVVPAERLGNRNAFGIRSFDDGRFFFVLRRGPVSVIGTTDTDYYKESKNLDEPWCTKADSDYLLATVNRLFPKAKLTEKDIIGTYAGIRPLIRQDGAANESAVSREHEIFETEKGVVAMAGGKLTTYRLMAEQFLFHLIEQGYLPGFSKPEHSRKSFSKQDFKVGLTRAAFDRELNDLRLRDAAGPKIVDHLYQQYGRQALDILTTIKVDPAKGQALLAGQPYTQAEIEFIIENEAAPKLLDVMCRRTEAQWMVWHHQQAELAGKVADIMAAFYGWDASRKQLELDEYLGYVKQTIWF